LGPGPPPLPALVLGEPPVVAPPPPVSAPPPEATVVLPDPLLHAAKNEIKDIDKHSNPPFTCTRIVCS